MLQLQSLLPESEVVADYWECLIKFASSLPQYQLILYSCIFLFIFYVLLHYLHSVWIYFLNYYFWGALLGYRAKWRPGPNSWALVTGSTSGIGLAYAQQLAHKGYSILLLSRSQDKLDKIRDQLLESYPQCQAVRTCAVDFTLGTEIYDHIADVIHSLPGHVHVLVNNVGMAYTLNG